MSENKRVEKDKIRFAAMQKEEAALREQGYLHIAGVDEAGRGPLAGPVYAAAVILDPAVPIYGLNDSKKLSSKRRLELATAIKANALAWAVCKRSAETIDTINILEATKEAMLEAIKTLTVRPDFVIIDAVKLADLPLDRQLNLTKADSKVNAVAAASILAKTSRDSEMLYWDEIYPQYGFAQHKGYGTAKHYEALDTYGPCSLHRESFLKTWRQRRNNNG